MKRVSNSTLSFDVVIINAMNLSPPPFQSFLGKHHIKHHGQKRHIDLTR